MKKFKYMLSVLALALVLTCVAKAPMAVKAEEATPAITDKSIEWLEETLTVTVKKGETPDTDTVVYYQVIKDKTVTDVKANAWIPAYKQQIDISTITKAAAVAVTLDPTTIKITAADIVEITAPVSKVTLTVDYSVEGDDVTDAIYSVLSGIKVVDISKNEVNYVKGSEKAEETLDSFITKYQLVAKRGAYSAYTSFTADDYNMLRSSNGTLYVRALPLDADGYQCGLASKETKVKVAKTAAAPTVKIDYSKGTIALKNGMEFKYDGVTYYVPAYNKEASATSKISKTDKTTKTKVSTLTPYDIMNMINVDIESDDDKIKLGTDLTIAVRTTATAKKYASWYGDLVIALPAAKIDTSVEGTSIDYNINATKKTILLKVNGVTVPEGMKLEYVLVGDDADVNANKFTTIKSEELTSGVTIKTFGKEVSYVKTDGTKGKVKAEEATAYVRFAAVVDKQDATKNAFASEAEAATKIEAVNVTFSGENATVKLQGSTAAVTECVVAKTNTVEFTVTVAEGYELVSVKIGESAVTEAEGVYTTTALTADTTITITTKAAASEPAGE